MEVFAIGDNVVDVYVDQHKMYLGGNALNFANMATEFTDIHSNYIGNFGSDELASYVKETLNQLNVDYSYSRSLSGESGFSLVTLKDGDRKFIGSNVGGVLKDGIVISKDALKKINRSALVHFNINANLGGHTDELLSRITGPKVVYDYSDFYVSEDIQRTIDNVDLACFSMGELKKEEFKANVEMIQRIADQSTLILITRGELGAVAIMNSHIYRQPATKVAEIKDTMGAGDSFITAFSIAFAREGWKEAGIQRALLAASQFSAKQIGVNGSFGYGHDISDDLIATLEKRVVKRN